MFLKKKQNIRVKICRSFIMRSHLPKNTKVLQENRYKDDPNSQLESKYRDLTPKFRFETITDKLVVEPQVGDRIRYFGKVEDRVLNIIDPRKSEEELKTDEHYARLDKGKYKEKNHYDLLITMQSEIHLVYGENLNDIPLKEVEEIYLEYLGMVNIFGGKEKCQDKDFWDGWREEFCKHLDGW